MFTYDFFKKLWGHYFGFLVTSALAFEARVDPSLECHGFLRFTSSVTPLGSQNVQALVEF